MLGILTATLAGVLPALIRFYLCSNMEVDKALSVYSSYSLSEYKWKIYLFFFQVCSVTHLSADVHVGQFNVHWECSLNGPCSQWGHTQVLYCSSPVCISLVDTQTQVLLAPNCIGSVRNPSKNKYLQIPSCLVFSNSCSISTCNPWAGTISHCRLLIGRQCSSTLLHTQIDGHWEQLDKNLIWNTYYTYQTC